MPPKFINSDTIRLKYTNLNLIKSNEFESNKHDSNISNVNKNYNMLSPLLTNFKKVRPSTSEDLFRLKQKSRSQNSTNYSNNSKNLNLQLSINSNLNSTKQPKTKPFKNEVHQYYNMARSISSQTSRTNKETVTVNNKYQNYGSSIENHLLNLTSQIKKSNKEVVLDKIFYKMAMSKSAKENKEFYESENYLDGEILDRKDKANINNDFLNDIEIVNVDSDNSIEFKNEDQKKKGYQHVKNASSLLGATSFSGKIRVIKDNYFNKGQSLFKKAKNENFPFTKSSQLRPFSITSKTNEILKDKQSKENRPFSIINLAIEERVNKRKKSKKKSRSNVLSPDPNWNNEQKNQANGSNQDKNQSTPMKDRLLAAKTPVFQKIKDINMSLSRNYSAKDNQLNQNPIKIKAEEDKEKATLEEYQPDQQQIFGKNGFINSTNKSKNDVQNQTKSRSAFVKNKSVININRFPQNEKHAKKVFEFRNKKLVEKIEQNLLLEFKNNYEKEGNIL